MASAAEGVPPPPGLCSAAAAVDDAEFREFVRGFNDLSGDQDGVEPAVLVIDAGRLHWKAGDAGDDSPSDLAPEGPDGVLLGVELQRLRSSGDDRSRQAEQQLLREQRVQVAHATPGRFPVVHRRQRRIVRARRGLDVHVGPLVRRRERRHDKGHSAGAYARHAVSVSSFFGRWNERSPQ